MINNRQAGRRNRGRNNGRPNGGNRNGDNGNRIDNRARGNAPQLLEKYRNMARDAQLAGDRVSTEYYLQFADHYFRVLADNRARQEEHQTRFRRNDEPFDFDGDQGEGGLDYAPTEDRRDDRRDYRRDRRPGQADDEFSSSDIAEEGVRAPAPLAVEAEAEAEPEPPRRGQRGRKPRQPVKVEVPSFREEQQGLDLAALPPAIARGDNDSGEEQAEAPAPRRRGRPRRAAAEAAE